MATKQIKCDECEKKNCPERLKGALCSISSELSPLVTASKTRDPIMMSKFIVSIVGSEYERYLQAKVVEDIGGEEEVEIMTKSGKLISKTRKNSVDNNVTNLAMNIIKSGKLLNEILNPPKAVPFNQTNIQNNFGARAADEIRNLGGNEKEDALKFIDKKLDAKRTS